MRWGRYGRATSTCTRASVTGHCGCGATPSTPGAVHEPGEGAATPAVSGNTRGLEVVDSTTGRAGDVPVATSSRYDFRPRVRRRIG